MKFHMRFGTVALILFGAWTSPTAPALAQRPSRDWAPGERVVISDARTILGVASTFDRVFAVTPSQVLVRRPQTQSWEGPFDPPEANLLDGVFSVLADPLDNSLWMVSPSRWVHFEPDLRVWTSGASDSRIVTAAFDVGNPVGGILLRTAAGWRELPRGGLSLIPSQPPARPQGPVSVSEFLRDHPALVGASTAVLLDGRLRMARFTAVTRSFDRLGWYLGTDGLGLLYLPEGSAIPERLPFGLAGASVVALFASPGGVWAISERTSRNDATITFVASDLREFRSIEGMGASGLPFNSARQMTGVGRALWAATDRGAARIDPALGDVRLIDDSRGLPDSRTLAIMSRQGWIGVATAAGAARLTDSLEVFPVAPDFHDAAYAITLSADTTFVGTTRGLFYTVGRQGELLRPAGMTGGEFQGPVVALRWLGTTLVALTRERMLWRERGGPWKWGPDLAAEIGALRAMVPYGDGMWIAGERGVGWARLGFPILRPVIDGDLPGDARDVTVDSEFLWVAAAGGLVRFRLDALR